MDDMEDIKDAKLKSLEDTTSVTSTLDPDVDEASKSTSVANSNELYKDLDKDFGSSNIVSDSNITPPSTDSSNTKFQEVNQFAEVESCDEKTNLTEKTETQEKSEESSAALAIGIAPVIGIPLARSSPISREFLALKKSLNDSKILTEFVADTSAVKAARKGRKSGLSSVHSGSRENSLHKSSNRSRCDPLDISNEDRIGKRANMRSQNSEFAQKHMDFLSRVKQQQQSGDEQSASETDELDRYMAGTIDDDDERHTNVSNSSAVSSDLALQDISNLESRLKDIWQNPPKRGWDSFCWRCRECAGIALIPCSKCLRSFHKHCIKVSTSTKLDNSWNCPECLAVENALSSPKKARRPELTLDMLSELLSFALKRMRSSKGNSKFVFAGGDFSSFSKYIVNPVTFASLEEKIAKKAFRCPEEFYNETKWMVHNAHILSTGLTNNKLIVTAKSIVKVCRQEANEIETCAGCYFSANTRSDWFVDVCAQPHLLLWAKLKGFPYWPAKAMGVGQNSVVNVRFFGKHDRAFVPIKDCFLFSEQDPNTQTGKRSARELADCIKEVNVHIKKIEAKVGKFNYAPFKTPYDPAEEQQQLEFMMSGVAQYMKRQQAIVMKPSLQYKIVKTADNNLSIIKKANSEESVKGDLEISHEINDNNRKESNKTSTSSCGSSESSKHITSKYEVITKTVSNDSNSPKLSTVILKKRKSLNLHEVFFPDSAKKPNNGVDISSTEVAETTSNLQTDVKSKSGRSTDVSLSTSKQARIENKDSMSMLCAKRKPDMAELNESDENNSEQQRVKHSRLEPRLPILSIKAGSAKIVEATAREVAENFAKSNTCVTIKKISKNSSEVVDTAPSNNNTNSRATRSGGKDTTVVVQSASKEKNNTETPLPSTTKGATLISMNNATNPSTPLSSSQTKTDKGKEEWNVFRELVPFVEIKQEVNSDGENEDIAPAVQSVQSSAIITQASFSAVNSSIAPVKANQKGHEEEMMESNLVRVKEEAFSDDETPTQHASLEKDNTNCNKTYSLKDVSSATPQAAVDGNSLSPETIRLVGDTTIQRVSTRNAVIAPSTAVPQSVPTAAPPIFVSTSSTNTALNVVNTTQSKRASNRNGIPFGPLPATATIVSAVATSKSTAGAENAFHQQHSTQQQQIQQNQRARKSFPNRSPPRGGMPSFPSMATANSLGLVISSPPAVVNCAGDSRRCGILKSTSMVSIPADVAAQRNIAQNSIPMPPLTAVSKITPVVSSITNSIAASNSPSSSPNSTTSLIGTITAAAFASTTNNVNNKCSSSSNPQSSTIPLNTLNQASKMNAPPPLAGLSYTSANTAISSATPLQPSLVSAANVPMSSGCNAIIPATNTEMSNSNPADNHLLGDFVTPALANAITEVICRGPPKMARRPNGPLQSDGSTMFPSEAGPVCRKLVQNAHKLTDFFISVMEDTMCDMSNGDEPSLQAKITLLTVELERLKQAHEQEIAELKRTSDLVLCEMRKSMENEKARLANEIRKQCELERLRCVEEAKRKQWCANCGREAQFYCCWNTSYCDYPCQQQHWGRHAATCAQTRPNDALQMTNSTTVGNSQPVMSSANSRNKPSALGSGSININVHSKNTSNSKKEKHNTALSVSSMTTTKNSSINVAAPTVNPVGSDTHKLPTNTYLRAVAPSTTGSNTNSVRSSGNSSIASPRFNISLPITTPVNSAPYTIVQRGSNWELLASSTNTPTTVNTVNTLAGLPTPSNSISTISNTHQQQRSATMPNIVNKGTGRNRGVTSLGYTTNSNGNMRPTKM